MLAALHWCGLYDLEAEMITWDELNDSYASYCLRILDGRFGFEEVLQPLPQHGSWFITETSLNRHSALTRPQIRCRAANLACTRLNGFFWSGKANLRNAP